MGAWHTGTTTDQALDSPTSASLSPVGLFQVFQIKDQMIYPVVITSVNWSNHFSDIWFTYFPSDSRSEFELAMLSYILHLASGSDKSY